MLTPPFEIISCSWPRPIEQVEDRWTSEPDWDAPLMPIPLQPHWDILNDEVCWTIDWRDLFRTGLKKGDPFVGGEMRGFHLVFRLRINESGTLVFWDDDGSVIRQNGKVVRDDRSAHPLSRSELAVQADDLLEVAQWQLYGDWLWGARLIASNHSIPATAKEIVLSKLEEVQCRLADPNGPPLKMYTDGHPPIRVIAALYSMILHGYAPSAVYLFGENQWHGETRDLFAAALPFAHVVPHVQVLARLRSLGVPELVELAMRYWFVMKTCVSLFCPPEEFCLMDDDVFILDQLDDALAAFQKNDLVFMPDRDLGEDFSRTWGIQARHFNTRKFNAGLYWLRQVHDARSIAYQALWGTPLPHEAYNWEQGLIALQYAQRNTLELPGQRYFYPLFDGLPGGMLGYDYALNPCGFASIHFGGLSEKPSDGVAVHILLQLLKRAHKLNGVSVSKSENCTLSPKSGGAKLFRLSRRRFWW